ncbi:glycerol-3-phosphate dehydrogenase C-terminal domain-containing protein, partial [Streptococcus pluranimalium]
TDYRKMAEGALKKVLLVLEEEYGRQFRLINSKTYPVSGGELNPAKVDSELETYAQLGTLSGLEMDDARYLANLYGSNVPKVYNLARTVDVAPGLDLKETLSLHYAMDFEMALSPADFFLRRTNHMLFKRDELDALVEPVITEMAKHLEWTEEEKSEKTAAFQELLKENDLAALKM